MENHQDNRLAHVNSRIENMRNMTPEERLAATCKAAGIAQEDVKAMQGNALPIDLANGMIENVIGKFELPLGVATNFTINNRDYLIPMAVEEPSVVAAASYMAKLVRENGGFETSSTAPIMRAQIQILGLSDPYGARLKILGNEQKIIEAANSRDAMLIKLGGGCRGIEVHVFKDSHRGPMAVVHLIVDVRDAMGANTVNTMAETVAPILEEITGGYVRLRILSNLADLRISRARIRLSPQSLATKEFTGERIIEGMLDAYELAAIDPYRAATHNKGIMNGIDPVIVATGNDWRAIEAGAHAYAVKNGLYTSLSTWEKDKEGYLVGTLEMPMAVGLVGGATKTHPAAQAALRILQVESAQELAQLIVAVGLAQNMAAMRALATEGIQRGHMALHARNIAIVAGAVGPEIDVVAKEMAQNHDVRSDNAAAILKRIRG